jgi:polar amino acid transport system permease protein
MMGLHINGVQVSILVFGLNSGAYISEIMRSGIQSVDPGQMEGGRSVGLSFSTTMMKVVLPQAVKNILPTLGNEFIALIKETSVVSFVGAADLYMAFNYIGSNSYEFMVPYLVMAMFYIVLVLIISAMVKLMERSLKKSDRSH